jgi:competence protein ComEC
MTINALARPSLAILDIGHGNAAVVADTKGVVILDAGLGPGLSSFLEDEKIETIDVVLLSHVHADHIGGLLHLISTRMFRIGLVRVNSGAERETAIWADLEYELEQLGSVGALTYQPSLGRESTEDFDHGVIHVEILGPSAALLSAGLGGKDSAGRRIVIHSLSAVVRLLHEGRPVALFPGDLDEVGLDELIRSGIDAKAPLLIYPHHGGWSGSRDEMGFVMKLCNLVQPEMIALSIGRGRHATPRPEIIEEVRRRLPHVRVACTQLSERCSANVPLDHGGHLGRHFAMGKHLRHCCAGTMVVQFDESGMSLSPIAHDHRQFILNVATTALCMRPFASPKSQ